MKNRFDDLTFADIYCRVYVGQDWDNSTYEYFTAEWVGDSPYLLISGELLHSAKQRTIEVPCYPLMPGMVIMVCQYVLQYIEPYERLPDTFLFERISPPMD